MTTTTPKKKTAPKRFTIDPANFTTGQWEELYNASTIMPRTYESHSTAKPFKRPHRYIALAIECVLNRADEVEDKDEDGEAWAADLRGAADHLRELIGEPIVFGGAR